MGLTVDKNYYPLPFTGSTMVSSTASGENTIEVHEFYNDAGKVVFYWKLKKDADGNLITFRCKIPDKPAAPAVTYQDYDSLT